MPNMSDAPAAEDGNPTKAAFAHGLDAIQSSISSTDFSIGCFWPFMSRIKASTIFDSVGCFVSADWNGDILSFSMSLMARYLNLSKNT